MTYNWTYRVRENGFMYTVSCPECGKGYNQDDEFGHTCEE